MKPTEVERKRWCGCLRGLKVETWSVIQVSVGCAMIGLSLFVPRWRVDTIGTTPLELSWAVKGFDERHYGLLSVKGVNSNSWSEFAQTACNNRNSASALAGAQAVASMFKKGTKTTACSSPENCGNGLVYAMSLRCSEYEKMWKISSTTVVGSFLSVLLIAVSALCSIVSTRAKIGGVTFAMMFLSGMICLILNIAWAAQTDSSLKKLGKFEWYPYASLGMGWWIHFYGSMAIVGGASAYGYLVLPKVFNYDEGEENLKKQQQRLQKMMNQPPPLDPLHVQPTLVGQC